MEKQNANSERPIFENISPLDHRYSISEKLVFDALSPFLSENAMVRACVKAEIALINAHLKMRGKHGDQLTERLKSLENRISPDEVYSEEAKTKHFVRALVNVMKAKLIDGCSGQNDLAELAPYVHLGATSADILDSASSYRIMGATRQVVLPLLIDLELLLCDFAEKEAETTQVGRTHGQHAVPVTLGFAISEYVSRLGKSILQIKRLSTRLKGKLAGAVGAYNATSMIVRKPLDLERLYLNELGLCPSEHSTQLVEPEYLLRLLLEFNTAFGIIANLADDLRNLQRSEIGEIREGFAGDQVGSSTMPQKRNPWNSEHVKSLWKSFMPRVMTFYMDQISDHQRDLTNSASARFIAEYITGFAMAASRMADVVKSIGVDKERLRQNLCGTTNGGGLMAEPAYILLAESGVSDAHEVIRRITLRCEKNGSSFAQELQAEETALQRITNKMLDLGLIQNSDTDEALIFFKSPSRYCGLAAQKAVDLSQKYRAIMKKMGHL
ncbi:MAG: lyase family protein [Termitinemataceae bacterium]|nr:MAG: lyase family protein [Termitinemataceae bacterium]